MNRAALFAAAALLSACTQGPAPQPVAVTPSEALDACALLTPRPEWRDALDRAWRDWSAPPELVLAIMFRESTFRADARPKHGTAYGYAQAKPEAWGDYQAQAGQPDAQRDNFRDAAHFIGWYLHKSRQSVRAKSPRVHYLAYHEGWTGYRRGHWREKAWLVRAAEQVDALTDTYREQLDACAIAHEI